MPDLPGKKTLRRVSQKPCRRIAQPRQTHRRHARRFIAFVVERNGKFLVRQRPAGVVNAHLWEFPNVEIGARLSEPRTNMDCDCKTPPAKDSSTQSWHTNGVAVRNPRSPNESVAAHVASSTIVWLQSRKRQSPLHGQTFHHALSHHAGSLACSFGGSSSPRPKNLQWSVVTIRPPKTTASGWHPTNVAGLTARKPTSPSKIRLAVAGV